MEFSKLSYTQVQAMADQLNTASTNMETLLNEIKSLFENVGNDGVWSGTAAATTKEQFDAVNDCYKYLLSVVENYKAVDAAINGQM